MEYQTSTMARTKDSAIKWFIWPLVVAAAILSVKPAHAEQLSLIVNGKALHLNAPADRNYNEKNWGGGLQFDFDKTENNWVPFVTASGFKDSNNNPSYYAGGGALKRFEFGNSGYHVDVGGVAFVMTRKGFRNDDPFLGALPVVSLGTERIALNITYVPKMDPKWVPLFFLQLKIGLYP